MTTFRRASALLLLLPGLVAGAGTDDLKAKADKGDAEAMFQLGRRYAYGKDVKKDETEALKWYLKAAAKDHTNAEVHIGSIYAHGFGVKQNWAESIKWYRRATLKGDPTAQHNLGLDYLHGRGVEKDAEMAAIWFHLAAVQGHARAQFNLAELYKSGTGVKQNEQLAAIYCIVATRHDNLDHIFGEEKAKQVRLTRDAYLKAASSLGHPNTEDLEEFLRSSQLRNFNEIAGNFESLVAVHHRRFGAPGGVGPTRGWYIWRKYDPATGDAFVVHEATGEIFKTHVRPWATTYRRLNYGSSVDAILPGERINAFFSPFRDQKRGLLVHYQDEIGQMKGHGHFWQITSLAKDDKSFTAIGMAGDKPLDGKELTFRLDPKCQMLQAGKECKSFPFKTDDHVYLTWRLDDKTRIVSLICDDAGLDAVKKAEAERLSKEIKTNGMAGTIDGLDGSRIHVCIFATYWSQAGQLKDGQAIGLKLDRPEKGDAKQIEGKLVFRKNRGAYGTGVTDIVVELKDPADAKIAKKWAINALVRVFTR